MAFKFTKKILDGKKIDIYNKGKMYRDYTYIDDIVTGITKLISKPPKIFLIFFDVNFFLNETIFIFLFILLIPFFA